MSIVEEFLGQEALAVAGVSRKREGYGYKVWRYLLSKGVRAYPVNPQAGEIDGERAYASVRELPEPVGGVIAVVPPERTVAVVRDCIAAGIERIWMQPGAECDEAIRLARESGIGVIANECILMK